MTNKNAQNSRRKPNARRSLGGDTIHSGLLDLAVQTRRTGYKRKNPKKRSKNRDEDEEDDDFDDDDDGGHGEEEEVLDDEPNSDNQESEDDEDDDQEVNDADEEGDNDHDENDDSSDEEEEDSSLYEYGEDDEDDEEDVIDEDLEEEDDDDYDNDEIEDDDEEDEDDELNPFLDSKNYRKVGENDAEDDDLQTEMEDEDDEDTASRRGFIRELEDADDSNEEGVDEMEEEEEEEIDDDNESRKKKKSKNKKTKPKVPLKKRGRKKKHVNVQIPQRQKKSEQVQTRILLRENADREELAALQKEIEKTSAKVNQTVYNSVFSESIPFEECLARAKCIQLDEKSGMSVDPYHTSLNVLHEFEIAKVLALRKAQLDRGAASFILDRPFLFPIQTHYIAQYELRNKLLPFIIHRSLGPTRNEYFHLSDMLVLQELDIDCMDFESLLHLSVS